MIQGMLQKSGTLWQCKDFEELTVPELYELLALRAEIFVVEQDCPYQDLDYKDQVSCHIRCLRDGRLAGYLRLIAPGVSYETPAIGRFVVRQDLRRAGLGRELLRLGVRLCREKWEAPAITLSGQAYLLEFYKSEGFVPVEGPYLEDGIPHYKMVLKTK